MNISQKQFWLKELTKYGVDKKDYDIAEHTLTKRFKKKTKESDIIWGLLNEAIIKNINDNLQKYFIYGLMSKFVREEGKNDQNQYLELSTKELLTHYKKQGHKKVSFLASISERTCKECEKLDGKIFDIDEALKNIPTPNKKCKSKDDNGYLNCRCATIAVS